MTFCFCFNDIKVFSLAILDISYIFEIFCPTLRPLIYEANKSTDLQGQ